MRRAAVVVLAAVAVLVPVVPAAACSSDSAGGVKAQLEKADGAFVGRLVKRRGNLFIYRVDTRVKGRIGRRVRVHGLRDCGPSVDKDRRVGMLLDRWKGRWEASAFSEVDAGKLLNAAGLVP